MISSFNFFTRNRRYFLPNFSPLTSSSLFFNSFKSSHLSSSVTFLFLSYFFALSTTMSQSASAASATSVASSSLSIRLRPSSARGHANHGWLNSYHTFSFASYYEPKFSKYHSLRVINEDRVSGGQGFGTHPHNNFEIFSYIVSGALSHKDSMGNTETIKRNDVQFTSAGTGIQHSEFNASKKDLVHFLQIWVKPDTLNLKPRYNTMSFSDKEKEGKLRLIIAPSSHQSSSTFIPINQDFTMYASILQKGESVSHILLPGRVAYLHLIQDVKDFESEYNKVNIVVNGIKINGGDGVFIERKGNENEKDEKIIIKAESEEGIKNEFVLFDMKAESQQGNNEDDDD